MAWIALVCIAVPAPGLAQRASRAPRTSTGSVVNYAPITVGGALILFGGWYLLSARKWFTGPVREAGTDEELTDIERELRAP